jgi:hypothetical protein
MLLFEMAFAPCNPCNGAADHVAQLARGASGWRAGPDGGVKSNPSGQGQKLCGTLMGPHRLISRCAHREKNEKWPSLQGGPWEAFGSGPTKRPPTATDAPLTFPRGRRAGLMATSTTMIGDVSGAVSATWGVDRTCARLPRNRARAISLLVIAAWQSTSMGVRILSSSSFSKARLGETPAAFAPMVSARRGCSAPPSLWFLICNYQQYICRSNDT